MRSIRFIFAFLLLVAVCVSCNKDLNVNADWKDITVVYGLLDQSTDTTYVKITKAFLGPGDAMQFAKIPDSSNYPDKLEVRLDEYQGTALIRSLSLDTVTVHNKAAGDSIFYYPDQLLYYTINQLNEDYTYKLFIKNKKTGKEVTAETQLVHDFEIVRPQSQASYPPGQSFEVKWTPALEGKRYQLLIRFFYNEYMVTDPKVGYLKSVDWIVFNNIKSPDVPTTQPFDLYFPSEAFYSFVGSKITKLDNQVDHRTALFCDYIFSVAAIEMNTYMEVTEPSLSLVQEKPSFTNIINGIGLFSSRFNKKQADTLYVSQITKDELKVNVHTKDLGF